ncbi:PLP-dependent aminotransferase family protein [Planococcus versutus]|uniref:Aminotransferase n=1 Tax=Planococcus versutus TaxID=1302659 RepID=A0A1B1RZ19_9BACL|nr:PLP-dependent aminotransferase family protein [Planococcus versutus]ANU26167.1 aminotransferase [Planococcus versutus]
MKTTFNFSKDIELAFKNDPPGQWLSSLPPGCLRLSSGYPDPKFVPSEDIKLAVTRLLNEEKDLPLHYMGSPRILQLKKFLQDRMAQRGVTVTDEEVLVTSGACQAIDLIARILLDEEAVVAIESPTYMEALEIFQNYTEQYITIPIDEEGMQTELLAEMLANRKEKSLSIPRLLYTIPTYQNPTGTTLSFSRRQQLLKLAEQYDFLIIEDDAYGELGFHDRPQLLKAMDTNNRVVYVGSLSKVVAPGMRIGWVVADQQLVDPLNWFKKDLTHPFDQATMASFLEAIDFDEHLTSLIEVYKSKCNVMLTALKEFLPPTVSWFVPKGGYFVWVNIPGVDTSTMLSQAFEAGVSYVPGKYFFLDQEKGLEYLRLSFSYATEEDIVHGVKLLAEIVAVTINAPECEE